MDPKVYENPRKFDIKRDHDKSLSFGQGPHYCIGVTLVRSQTEVMLKELFKRFPNLSLGDEIKYNYDHHNARRMEVMKRSEIHYLYITLYCTITLQVGST